MLAVAGCSPAINLVPETGQNARIGTTSDINPRDPATLQDGGNLRLALTDFPPNFNILHIDGNSADVSAMMKATLPRAFVIGPDGSTTVDTDYFTSVELTGTAPQVVTYTINPKAVWSDGTPITWEDIASQIHALSGADKTFEIAGSSGAERVASVTRGVDDRQAVVTFAKPYAEWRGMFAGNGMLLPKSMTATPEAFNKGQLEGPGPSAGPFIVSSLDRTTQRIVLSRNPKWWGTRPRLDSITYLVLDDAARLPALQNNTIDATGVGTLDQLTIAEHTAGISIRRAPARPGPTSPSTAPRLDPGRPGAARRGVQGHRSADHRQGGAVRPHQQPGGAGQSHLRRRTTGLSGQQHDGSLRPGRGRPGARRVGLEAARPVPREGRAAAGHPRSLLRRPGQPAVRPDRAAQPGPNRRQARTRRPRGQRILHQLHQRRRLRHGPIRLAR
ncbi:bacterial extracellular solute-binding s, 5 Middle family protein [Mycobacterium avium subsp. avium 2285 (R)]|nr:bacterial extracellular solute-binding s, 5 Middle family protein [Mycobacterium avium subsp. avium 2285 (R)]